WKGLEAAPTLGRNCSTRWDRVLRFTQPKFPTSRRSSRVALHSAMAAPDRPGPMNDAHPSAGETRTTQNSRASRNTDSRANARRLMTARVWWLTSHRASPVSWVSPPLRPPGSASGAQAPARCVGRRRGVSAALAELDPERELVIRDALGHVLRVAPDLLAVLRQHQAHRRRAHVRRHRQRDQELQRAAVVLRVRSRQREFVVVVVEEVAAVREW